eukprot:1556361-Amphidinium_carterae.1
MDRGLADFCCSSFDSFLIHHVTCSGSESNGAETFACGGVNCRDRRFRHLKEGTAQKVNMRAALKMTPHRTGFILAQ